MSSRDEQPARIAPERALLRYLSVMRRAMTTLALYGKTRDRAGLRFAGLLANALHNVPLELLHHDDPHIQGPLPLDRWLEREFPGQIARMGMPEHILAAYASIVSRGGEHAELGLQPDGKGMRRAPDASMRHHLHLLHEIWLGLRMLLGSSGEHVPDDENHVVWDWVSLLGRCMGRVPVILVRWSEARESAFWESAFRRASASPAPLQASWRKFVEDARPAWVKLGPSQEKAPIASPPSPPPAQGARSAGPPSDRRSATARGGRGAELGFRFRPYQWVTEHIALGSAVSEEDIDALVRDGITHVIDCRLGPGSKALYERTGIVYLQIGVADDGKPKADAWFWSGIDFATRALRMPRSRLLVHCKMGMSRSPTMVYAILLTQGMSSEDAQALISKSRIVARVTYETDARRAARRWVRRSKVDPKEL